MTLRDWTCEQFVAGIAPRAITGFEPDCDNSGKRRREMA